MQYLLPNVKSYFSFILKLVLFDLLVYCFLKTFFDRDGLY